MAKRGRKKKDEDFLRSFLDLLVEIVIFIILATVIALAIFFTFSVE